MAREIISPILTDNGSVEDLGPGGVLNQLPSLKQTAELEREKITRFNEYKDVDNLRYESTHPNALSDGDEYGKGENNGKVGGSIYQQQKQTLIYASGNKYKPGNGYYGFNYPEQYW